MDPKKNAKLREMLNNPGLIVAPACHDAVCAKIVEKLGFQAAHVGGNVSAGTMIGKPDIGLLSFTEMIDKAHKIASAIDIPLIADADTGS